MSMSMSVVPRWRGITGVVLINLRFFNHIQSYLQLALFIFSSPCTPSRYGAVQKGDRHSDRREESVYSVCTDS